MTRFLEEGLRLRLEKKSATPAAPHTFRVFAAPAAGSRDWDTIRRLAAGDRHRGIISAFITDLGLVGNDVNDAWLAALAIESRATLVSTDQGFDRFPGLA